MAARLGILVLAACLLAGAKQSPTAPGGAWRSFVNSAIASGSQAAMLNSLQLGRGNAEAFARVMDRASVPLSSVLAFPEGERAAQIRTLTWFYAKPRIARAPDVAAPSPLPDAELAATLSEVSDLREALGALPPDARNWVIAADLALRLEADRRKLAPLLKEPADWKERKDAGAVAAGDSSGSRAAALEKASPKAPGPGLAQEPPSPSRPSVSFDAAQKNVIVDGAPFAQTNRTLEMMRGIDSQSGRQGKNAAYPLELLDAAAMRRQGWRVADVGMGRGGFVLDLRSSGVDAVGVDPYLSPWQKRRPEAFLEGFAETLPFADASLDAIYCTFSVFYYKKGDDAAYARYLREFVRVLKPGGRIRISPFLPKDLAALLRRVPELKLNPDVAFLPGPGAKHDKRAMTWKGKPWDGEAFVELIRD